MNELLTHSWQWKIIAAIVSNHALHYPLECQKTLIHCATGEPVERISYRGNQGVGLVGWTSVLHGLDGIKYSQVENIHVWRPWWLTYHTDVPAAKLPCFLHCLTGG